MYDDPTTNALEAQYERALEDAAENAALLEEERRAKDGRLWDDNTIIAAYQRAFDRPPDVHHMALMCWIRDEMQAQFNCLAHDHDALERQLASVTPSDEVREAIMGMVTHCRRRSPMFGVGKDALLVEAWLAAQGTGKGVGEDGN